MKKILLTIFLILCFIEITYTFLSERECYLIGFSDFELIGNKVYTCTDKFYTTYDNTNGINKVIIKDIFLNEKYYINLNNNFIKNKYYHKDIKLIESKYGKHTFLDYYPIIYREPLYLIKNKTFNKYYKEYNEYIKENEKYFGLYLDGKKILDYGVDKEETDYNSIKDFFQKNNIVSYGDDGEVYVDGTDVTFTIYGTMKGKFGNIVLMDKTIKKLDDFLLKTKELNYSQEKLFKKVDSLYNKYNGLDDIRSKRIAEILLYLRIELLIQKLKKSNDIKKVNFYS